MNVQLPASPFFGATPAQFVFCHCLNVRGGTFLAVADVQSAYAGPCSLHLITWVSPSAFSNNATQLACVGEPGMKQLVEAKKPENCYLGRLCLHRAVRGQLLFSPPHKIKGDTKMNGKHHNKSSPLIAMIVPRKTHHFLDIDLAY